MRSLFTLAAIGTALALTVPGEAEAQSPPPPGTEVGAKLLAMPNLPPKKSGKIIVKSPAFADHGDIPFENTQYKGNIFPGLSWTAGPAGTKAYILIMQDGDILRNDMPILHWTLVNIPGNVTRLDAGMSAPPAGAQYGPNIRGANQPYTGPHTPAGPKHRYHFQIFAMDGTVPVDSTTTYATLTASMKEHVLESGELIGLGQIMPAAKP